MELLARRLPGMAELLALDLEEIREGRVSDAISMASAAEVAIAQRLSL